MVIWPLTLSSPSVTTTSYTVVCEGETVGEINEDVKPGGFDDQVYV